MSLCQYVLRPRRGQSLEAPRLQALETRDLFHQQNRKGKIVMTKTSRYKGLVLGSFLVPEIDMIFGDGVGASLVVVLVAQLVSRHSCVADRLPVVVRFPAGPRVRFKYRRPAERQRARTKKNIGR